MDSLPNELLFEIMSEVKDLETLDNLKFVNKKFKNIVDDFLKRISIDSFEQLALHTNNKMVSSLYICAYFREKKNDRYCKYAKEAYYTVAWFSGKKTKYDYYDEEDDNVDVEENSPNSYDYIRFDDPIDLLKYRAIVENNLDKLKFLVKYYDNDYYFKIIEKIFFDPVDGLSDSSKVDDTDNLFYAAIRWDRVEIVNWLSLKVK